MIESEFAPNHPEHVQEVLDHIAHLEDEQVAEIRTTLNAWHEEAMGRKRQDAERCTCPMGLRTIVHAFNEQGGGPHHSLGCPLWRKAS